MMAVLSYGILNIVSRATAIYLIWRDICLAHAMSLTNTLLDSTALFLRRRINRACRSHHHRDFIRFPPGFGKAVFLQLLFMAMPKEQKQGIADPVLKESFNIRGRRFQILERAILAAQV
jgi:hypothetical protein